MKKLEALKQLRETVLAQPLARGEYVTVTQSGECHHCAIGHLLANAGLPLFKIAILDDSEKSPYDSYGIKQILQDDIPKEEDYVGNIMIEMGFERTDFDKIYAIQSANDYITNDDNYRKERVLKKIDEWITQLESGTTV